MARHQSISPTHQTSHSSSTATSARGEDMILRHAGNCLAMFLIGAMATAKEQQLWVSWRYCCGMARGLEDCDLPTPLHCAANSGWLSHARALFEAGAPVYTWPGCSPLCWVHGGSAGHNRVVEYLRDLLGDVGLALIDEDHARAGAARHPNP